MPRGGYPIESLYYTGGRRPEPAGPGNLGMNFGNMVQDQRSLGSIRAIMARDATLAAPEYAREHGITEEEAYNALTKTPEDTSTFGGRFIRGMFGIPEQSLFDRAESAAKIEGYLGRVPREQGIRKNALAEVGKFGDVSKYMRDAESTKALEEGMRRPLGMLGADGAVHIKPFATNVIEAAQVAPKAFNDLVAAKVAIARAGDRGGEARRTTTDREYDDYRTVKKSLGWTDDQIQEAWVRLRFGGNAPREVPEESLYNAWVKEDPTRAEIMALGATGAPLSEESAAIYNTGRFLADRAREGRARASVDSGLGAPAPAPSPRDEVSSAMPSTSDELLDVVLGGGSPTYDQREHIDETKREQAEKELRQAEDFAAGGPRPREFMLGSTTTTTLPSRYR